MGAVSECAKANKRQADHDRDEWYKSRGICPRCTRNYCKPGYVHCEECLKAMRDAKRRRDPTGEHEKAYNRERRQQLIAKGLCPVCGKRKHAPGIQKCATCRQNAWDSIKKLRMHQKTVKGGP